MKWKAWFLAVAAIVVVVAGCGPTAADMDRSVQQLVKQSTEGNAIPGNEMAAIPKEIIELIKDQGVLKEWMANGRIRGQNPGLAIRKRVEYSYIIGLDGTYLEAQAETNGTGTLLLAGVRQSLIDVLAKLEGRTDAEAVKLREYIISLLGWNRDQVKTTGTTITSQ